MWVSVSGTLSKIHPQHTHCCLHYNMQMLWLWFAFVCNFIPSQFNFVILSFLHLFIYMLLEHITFHYMTQWCWQGTTNKHSNKCNLSPAGMNGYGIVINLIVPITMRVQSIFAHSANNKIRGCTSFDPLCEKLLHLTVIRVMSAHYTKYFTIPITQSQ